MNVGETLATYLVDELARGGVRHAVLSPGSRSTPLALQLHEHSNITLDVVVDERSAAFMALGHSKATGIPSVVLCTSGTAAANFYPAVIEASMSMTPLIVLTSDRPPELRDRGANQTIDQTRLYGSYPRWYFELDAVGVTPDAIALWQSTAARAIALALRPNPGAVHLNVAFRDPLVATNARAEPAASADMSVDRYHASSQHGHLSPPDSVFESITRLIESAARGVIVSMGPVDADAATALAAAAGWPLLADPISGARRGDNAVSTYDSLLRTGFLADEPPDVIIRAGTFGTSAALAGWARGCDEDVLFDEYGRRLDPENTLTRLVAAPSSIFGDIAAVVAQRPPSDWAQRWFEADAAARTAIDAILDGQARATEPGIARDLAALLSDGSDLVVASSMPVRDLEGFMAPRSGLRVLANRGASGIDGFISTAAGIARAGAPTVAFAGDLSLVHDRNGLQAARTAGIDLTIVVVNNGGGGIFKFMPQAQLDTFDKLFLTPHGIKFRSLAAADGFDYRRLKKASDLGDALAAGGRQIVEVVTDPGSNLRLHEEIWNGVRLTHA